MKDCTQGRNHMFVPYVVLVSHPAMAWINTRKVCIKCQSAVAEWAGTERRVRNLNFLLIVTEFDKE